MTCSLARHLARQLILAKVKDECVEVARLEKDLADHAAKCMVCMGLYRPLTEHFFGGQVKVIGDDYPTSSSF